MRCVFLFIGFLMALPGIGQNTKYWIYYDAPTSREAVCDSLLAWRTNESYYSEWLGASSAALTATQVVQLETSFPNVTLRQGRFLQANGLGSNFEDLNFALEQIHADTLVRLGLTGKGVKIGIIDGGFLDAPKAPKLQHFFANKRIAAYKDFITPKLARYGGNRKLDDQHGTEVWEMVGGYHPEKAIRHGLATEATYYLARTDHGGGEKRIEEEYFVQALEWMAKKGIRLVNTSLGYTNGYDDPKEDYVPTQMNGTTAIAMACQKAIEAYDMIIVGAAGNEGQLPWKVINTPADAPGVIAVGASKITLMDKMSYSSIGPEFLDYLKPELTCYSSSGTSFAAPVITGLVACMLQLNPELSNQEVRNILMASCNLYPYGNNYVGHGVPDARKIITFMQQGLNSENDIQLVQIKSRTGLLQKILPARKFRFRPGGATVVVYHKYDQWKVRDKQLILPERKKTVIEKPERATQSTVIAGDRIYELFWQ